jgi:drug/metabolite transporter (DMT)-like permease
MLGACLITLAVVPFFSSYSELLDWHGLDWLWLLVLAWVCTVFAHGFQIHLLRHFNVYTMILAINFEPIYGVIAAAFLFSEYKELNTTFYIGMVTTIAANLLHPLVLRWQLRKRGLVLETDPAEP